MDKDWKLRQYQRKDYTDLVEFPVEIVGRDGVVRRYTFEDSIRLYQRRLSVAPIRYSDVDLVGAEVGHCRARIGQLRRSFFQVFGWGRPVGQEPLGAELGPLAGEVAAFLCRVLRCTRRLELSLQLVDAGDEGNGPRTYLVVHPRSATTILLYVHDYADAEDVRQARFFADLKWLESAARSGREVERLLAFHHTADCGFLLTVPSGSLADFYALAEDEPTEESVGGPTAWDLAVVALRRGDHAGALEHCRDLLTDQPYHRRAQIAGALLALAVDRVEDADDIARIGLRYFPRDADLHAALGMTRLRNDDARGGLSALERAAREGAARPEIELLTARAELMSWRPWAAWRRLRALEAQELDAAARHLHATLRRSLAFGSISVAAVVVGIVNLWPAWPFGVVPLVVMVGLVTLGRSVFRERLLHALRRVEDAEITATLRRVQRRGPDAAVS